MANKKKAQSASARFAVSAHREGFRRAGRPWSTVPAELDASELAKDQWKLLRQDPMIQVTQIGGEEAAPAAAEEQQEATSEEQQEAAPAEQDKAAQSPPAKA